MPTSRSGKSPASRPIQPLLRMVDLQVRREGVKVLDGLTWEVTAGQHWCILGPNGCGKTSLLNALCGFLPPSSGGIHLFGKTYGEDDWQFLREKIGIISSSVRQMIEERETALEVILSGRYGQINYWGIPKRADMKAAIAMAERVKCTALMDRPWAVLSQGERQRVLVGRALLGNPGILILDEPCAGLDPAAREKFLHFLREFIAASGTTIPLVLVTHHIEEIVPGFTHVLGLQHGTVLFSGELKKELTSANLSALFGAACTVQCKKGGYALAIEPMESSLF